MKPFRFRMRLLAVAMFLATPLACVTLGQSQAQSTQGNVASGAAANPAPKAAPSYSVEVLHTAMRFESDGTGSRDMEARIQVQSEAAVRDFGILRCEYDAASEDVAILDVDVRKPDGTVISTSPGDAQDLDTEVTRSAPMYTDRREKHLAVRSLAAGDQLEYHVRWTVKHPLAPGNFWFLYEFEHKGLVKDEQLEINVPAERHTRIASPAYAASSRVEQGRRIYTFHGGHREQDDEKEGAAWEALFRSAASPDVQLSSFESWEDVGKWYEALQKPQVKVTKEIQAKADELTRGKSTDNEKLKAIYTFVSTQFRYISISLGAGRYTPHASDEVLSNKYGDCKDKHTLFAALLRAGGIKAYPVLISTAYRTSPDFPTPALFDHLITAIPSGDSYLYLDTTPEVAPFGLLSFQIRNKFALVLPDGAPARLLKTPEGSVADTQTFTMDAAINDQGVLDGKAHMESHGDQEILQRQIFLQTAPDNWTKLVQAMSQEMGFGGTVENVSATQPQALSDPFRISYTYHRPDFPDWPNHRIALALPFLGLPQLSDEEIAAKLPLPLGPHLELAYSATISLPKGYQPEVPPRVEIKRDFATYTASFSFADGALHVTHKFVRLLGEIPAERRADYAAFAKAVLEDETRQISISEPNESAGNPVNPEAQRLYGEARESLLLGAPHSAKNSLEQALKVEPEWTKAWVLLGQAHMMSRETLPAIEAFRKAVYFDPSDAQAYQFLAVALSSAHKDEEAAQTWRRLLRLKPNDPNVAAMARNALLAAGQYAETRPLLESALEKQPDNPGLHLQLGEALLHLDQEKDALAQFAKAADLDDRPEMRNEIAYALAEANRSLTEAAQYATQAVSATEAKTGELRWESDLPNSFRLMAELAAEWDTLGWVRFRASDFPSSAKYLRAAWMLMQSPVVGDHLGQALAKLGDTQGAARTYAMTLRIVPNGDAGKLEENISARLAALPKGAAGTRFSVYDALRDLRTYSVSGVKDWGGGYKSANFAVAFTKGPVIKGVLFQSGADELEESAEPIEKIKFDIPFPDDGPTVIVREGILNCSEVSKSCSFVLLPVTQAMPQQTVSLPAR